MNIKAKNNGNELATLYSGSQKLLDRGREFTSDGKPRSMRIPTPTCW
jgi:hypothetical protein